MGEIFEFRRPQKIKTKSCLECKFLTNRKTNSLYWKCGVSGSYCDIEITGQSKWRCGADRKFFEVKPLKPPSFWQRLSDAIIERIKGNRIKNQP